jgi:hypothetical protein
MPRPPEPRNLPGLRGCAPKSNPLMWRSVRTIWDMCSRLASILVIVRQRLLIALIVTVGVAFMLGFVASSGVLGSHGWAVALLGGSAICASIGVVLVPRSRRRRTHRLHLLRR